MIQRVQTLWLALAVVLAVASFFFPVAVFEIPFKDMQYPARYYFLPQKTAEYQIPPATAAIITSAVTALILLVTVFLYKKRPLQMKVLAFGLLGCIVQAAIIFFYQADAGLSQIVTSLCKGTPGIIDSTIKNANTVYNLTAYFPFMQMLCCIFALNGIKKDEQLVRSSDRLR
ncbi:MAG: DUF4293 domain-containing protein [Bacteroidales bacterium]|nr:DUF4293 domain-containing protein [Bacteroidales bacterium]